MSDYRGSINQMAKFAYGTKATKRRIVSQQLQPNQFLIPWYQLTKARIRKSLTQKGDIQPITDGLETLMNKVPINKRQKIDRQVSIEALEKFIRLKLPQVLTDVNYEVVKTKINRTVIGGVEIIVLPDVIVKGVIDGITVLGCCKIYISKGAPFDRNQAQYVSNTLFHFLQKEIATKGEIVMPNLCYTVDVFGGRIVPASENVRDDGLIDLEIISEDYKLIWDNPEN